MFEPFTLVVPAESRFRPIASDVASRLAELAGGSAQGLSAAVAGAIDTVANGASASDEVRLHFRRDGDAVVVDLACGARSHSITVPL
jgi:hypothetical protein